VAAPAADEKSEISRRNFLKLGGALAAAGLVGIGMSNSSGLLSQHGRDRTSEHLSGSASLRRPAPAKPKPLAASFSIFWITDTQFLSESNPALFTNMTRWISDQWNVRNGKMVIHTGDLVQTGSAMKEWENADAAMSVLLNNGIPYTWCAGNHDDLVLGDPSQGWNGSLWTSAFNPSVASSHMNALSSARWVDDHHNGMNTAVAFSANGMNFLVVTIEWNADSHSVLKWVEALLEDPAYSDHFVIIAPHAYINPVGTTNDPTWGPQLSTFDIGLTAIMDRHSSNVFLTLNGHFPTDSGYHTPHSKNYRHELMFDRQDSTDDPSRPMASSTTPDANKVGGATVTIMTFYTEKNLVNVETYDTFTGSFRDNLLERFSFMMCPQLQTPDPSQGTMLSNPSTVIESGPGGIIRPPSAASASV
jgi:hypothetical protein